MRVRYEVVLQRLLGRVKYAALAGRRWVGRSDHAGGGLGAEITIVVVDCGCRVAATVAIEREEDRLPLLLLAYVGLLVVEQQRHRATTAASSRLPAGTGADCAPMARRDRGGTPRRRPRSSAREALVVAAPGSRRRFGATGSGGAARRRCGGALLLARGESAINVLICSRESGPGRYDIAQRLVKVVGLLALARVQHELSLRQTRDRVVDRLHVGRARGVVQTIDQPCFVAFGLQPSDHPRARVGDRLVVDVDGVLRGEHHPDAERARLLEDREDRLLGGRSRSRRNEAEHLVHVHDDPEVGRARLLAHPCDELREHERHDELTLFVRQVRRSG